MPDPARGAATPGQSSPVVALGFDFGLRRIGVAAGDTLTCGARPVGVVTCHGGTPDWTSLGRYIRDWEPRILVVGVPYNMDGTAGSLTPTALEFITELGQRFEREVVGVDERLSSREAEDILRRQRASGERTRRVRHGDVDAAAACVLLEQWLRERGLEPRSE
ncbi:MAG: Holliday junction resolvase RuvX [Proteobacteria bacterium]|nr:Holliday junction resolvase RuvX [Pseudomonadota bacterium]